MTIDEQLQASPPSTSRHSEQLESDGRHIRQFATIVQDMHRNIQETREEMKTHHLQTREETEAHRRQVRDETEAYIEEMRAETEVARKEMRELRADFQRITNGIEALLNKVASHGTRIDRIEGPSE